MNRAQRRALLKSKGDPALMQQRAQSRATFPGGHASRSERTSAVYEAQDLADAIDEGEFAEAFAEYAEGDER